MKYNYNQDIDDLNDFVSSLPHQLKVEVSLFIHESTYEKITYLQEKTNPFIAWICPLFKPLLSMSDQYVFFEGDDVKHTYFLKSGECGFVLPKHSNLKYIEISEGSYFGIIDIVGSLLKLGISDVYEFTQSRSSLKR